MRGNMVGKAVVVVVVVVVVKVVAPGDGVRGSPSMLVGPVRKLAEVLERLTMLISHVEPLDYIFIINIHN